jgi:cysteinyl-tRNA synthetase
MKIKLYNSLSKKLEDFKPVDENEVKMYSCGPTIYDHAHIGNMRSFLFGDLLQRVIRVVGGYNLKWVMNLTDIDDKTIKHSKPGSEKWHTDMGEQTEHPLENLKKYTDFYKEIFLEDIGKLGISKDDFYAMPRATEYIPSMQNLVKKIFDNGYAYIADDSVYFDVSKWSRDDKYGKLFNIDPDNFRKGERIDADEYERENVSDFVLWKGRKEGEPWWNFSLDGKELPGRPGWHLECSSMEYDLLGVPFDIHTGGVDLKFPHHEDEIAQSKAGYGVEPTNYWCHNEFLEVEGNKMSKSLGNFFTLNDIKEKGLDPLDVRFAMMSSHYASKYNFTVKGIEDAHKARERVQNFIYALYDKNYGTLDINADDLRTNVWNELANDLHTPKALAELFKFINTHKPDEFTKKTNDELKIFFKELNDIFAVWSMEAKPEEENQIPDEIIAMANARLEAKKSKNWSEADRLRNEIQSAGYYITDKKDGFEIQIK